MNLSFVQIGTSVVNALINAKKAIDKSPADEIKNLPVIATSFNYGVYLAVSSNLRYVELQLKYSFMHLFTSLLYGYCYIIAYQFHGVSSLHYSIIIAVILVLSCSEYSHFPTFIRFSFPNP